MTKPVIVTRANKGLALTYTEQDANFTNLQNATIGISANGQSITANLNGNLSLIGGTGVTLTPDTINNTLTISRASELLYVGPPTGTFGYSTGTTLNFANGAGISITGNSSTNTITITNTASNLSSPPAIGDVTPNTGAFTTLTANTNLVITSGAASIDLKPGSGLIDNITIGSRTPLTGQFSAVYIGPVGSTAAKMMLEQDVSGNATLSHNKGTLKVYSQINDSTTKYPGYFTTINASSTVSGTGFSNYLASPPAIGLTTANSGNFTGITATSISGALTNYRELINTLLVTSGTITPDAQNGNVQKISLSGNLTWNAFANPVVGQSITLVITHTTANNTLSSTMKFANSGTKTLSTTSGAIDVIHVFYDGTNYLASLSKGFS